MRRLLATGLALLTGCSFACGTPAPTLHPDVLLIVAADGSRVIVRNPGGTVLGRLPSGILALALSGGDDIAEAYLVAPGSGGTTISTVQPNRGYALARVATLPAPPAAAALKPAPQLTAYVGPKTVLVVLSLDGTLAGYQHGTRIWAEALGPEPAQLVAVGTQLFLGRRGGWSEVTVETGTVGALKNGIRCDSPGPLAVVEGTVVFDCVGLLDPGGEVVPNDRPIAFPAGAATVLAFPDGEVWRLQSSSSRRVFTGPSWAMPPAPSLDGSLLYVPTVAGVEQVNVGSGDHHRLTSAAGINPSIALSRDGNFLYALAGGTLRSFRLDTGGQVASLPVSGVAIERVIGG
jgi:hypothetical protein